jgi:DNA-binding GntR family transcriptional regulator
MVCHHPDADEEPEDLVSTPIGRPLWRELLEELDKRIADGTLAPGQRLVEQDIAAEFGVSRGPVREAFAELSRTGLIELNARRGAGVRVFTERDIRELYELRECLEVCALAGAGPIDDEALARIKDKLEVAAEARRSQEIAKAVAADMEFHRELCHLSANRRLIAVWETQATQIRVVISSAHHGPGSRVLPVLAEHDRIFDALVARDHAAAQDALRHHLRSALDLVIPPPAEPTGSTDA